MKYYIRTLGTALSLFAALSLFTVSSCDGQKGRTLSAADSLVIQDSIAAAKLEAEMSKYDRYWNDYARYLAGMEPLPGSKLDTLEKRPEAANHRKYFSALWQRKQDKLLTPLKKWASEELPEEHKAKRTAFYPFGAADFMTINTIYNRADQYVLLGLEKEGYVKDIRHASSAKVATIIQDYYKAMEDILGITFFKTKDMAYDLYKHPEVQGLSPILLIFVARQGYQVLDFKHVKVTPQGTIEELPQSLYQTPFGDTVVTGVRIYFREPKGAKRMLTYLSLNIDNNWSAKSHMKGTYKYLNSLKPTHTYIKAASYLMYESYFTTIKDLVNDVSETYLQDDSGQPLKNFDPKLWDLKFYGVYDRPIDLFANKYQPDLHKVYNQDSSVKKYPLNFDIGYDMVEGKIKSNLMLARKKKAAQPATPPGGKGTGPAEPAK